MIRERVILAADRSRELVEAGISVSSGEAASIRINIEGSSVRPKALHRPMHAAAVAEDAFDFGTKFKMSDIRLPGARL